jgi:hypothetical protein
MTAFDHAPVLSGAPPLALYDDVLAVSADVKTRPMICGLFDAAGAEIPGAVSWRDGSTPSTRPPPGPPPPPEAHLAGTYLFGGLMAGHFGHVICESMARLWALDAVTEEIEGLVFFANNPRDVRFLLRQARRVFDGFGIRHPVHIVTAPTLIDRLVVARQGFGVEDLLVGTPEFRAYMRRLCGAPAAVPEGARKLYLSREKQANRRGYTIGEIALQGHLAEAGFEIFHPEDHDLAGQMAAYREAACIVSSDGSALHIVGFAAPTGCEVVMLQRRKGPTMGHIARSLAQFLGRAPRVVHGTRAWSGAKPRVAFSFVAVPFSEVGEVLGLRVPDRPDAEIDREIADLSVELRVDLTEEPVGPQAM